VLAILHFLWQAKAAERWEPLIYAGVLALLLFVRIPNVRHAIVRFRERVLRRPTDKAVTRITAPAKMGTTQGTRVQHTSPPADS
jgi:DMSO/TMAO reductase YedYZ heme-binding membrane subunit